jgi:acetyl esterase/lipase
MDAQGYRIARWLNERGIAAFVLKYRLVPTPANPDEFVRMLQRLSPPYDGPPAISAEQARDEEVATLQDGLAAIRYIRAHSSQWRIAPDRIGIIGFSAGAYGALNVALRSTTDSRPNLVAAIYGALPDGATVTAAAPPAFIAAATDDPQVPSMQSIKTYSAWREANIPVELHLFQNGGHGFGAQARTKSSDQWLGLFDHWLELQGFEGSSSRRVSENSSIDHRRESIGRCRCYTRNATCRSQQVRSSDTGVSP